MPPLDPTLGDGQPTGCVSADADDHCWAEPVCADGVMTFTHNFLFDRVDEAAVTRSGSNLAFEISGLELALAEVPSTLSLFFLGSISQGQQVGYYRLGTSDPSSGTASYSFQGIIDPGSEYRFEIEFDVDGDGQPSMGDVTCGFTATAEVMDGVWTLSRAFSMICNGR